MAYMNHTEPYSDDYLQQILSSVKTIAMVGASPDTTKFSYGVLRVLHETGYEMIYQYTNTTITFSNIEYYVDERFISMKSI